VSLIDIIEVCGLTGAALLAFGGMCWGLERRGRRRFSAERR
jgi:hypothetical protein